MRYIIHLKVPYYEPASKKETKAQIEEGRQKLIDEAKKTFTKAVKDIDDVSLLNEEYIGLSSSGAGVLIDIVETEEEKQKAIDMLRSLEIVELIEVDYPPWPKEEKTIKKTKDMKDFLK